MISIDVAIELGNKTFTYRLNSSSQRIVLFGPSGSGKSTLLKLIAGFFQPHQGSVRIHNQLFFDKSQKINVPIYERKTGYLPQEYTLFPHLTVKENIVYGGSFAIDRYNTDRDKRLRLLTERLGIAPLLDRLPGDLSGGEQQRVALARALFVKPSVLLLDEPFSALDADTRTRLRDMVLDLTTEMNITTFFVTHDLTEAFIMAEDIAVIDHGCIYESGKIEPVFTRPRFIETARLLGFGNELPLAEAHATHVITESGLVLEHESPHESGTVATIRPDQIMILRDDHDYATNRENLVTARVLEIRRRVRSSDITVTFNDHLMTVSLAHHAAQKLNLYVGKNIPLSLKKESLVVCKSYRDEKNHAGFIAS